jgi:hypothetical protein
MPLNQATVGILDEAQRSALRILLVLVLTGHL